MDSSPAPRPQRIIMEGRHVTLAPLDPAAHAHDLWEATRGAESDALWRYLFDGPYPDRASFDAQIVSKAASEDPLFFAIFDRHSQRPVGWAAYMRIEPRHRVIEIGSILFTRAIQRRAWPRPDHGHLIMV
ncbi:GCN5-related N-acetyltransferase (fragment) [Candidatus Sulfopaludibacter sp. SbA4]